MRATPAAPLAGFLAIPVLLAACGHARLGRTQGAASDAAAAGVRGSPDAGARKDCRIAFALCAPPVSYAPDVDVEELGVRSLVQIAWRLDLPDALCEKAGERLRRLAERGDAATVREIADAADVASATLGRCRCEGDRFRTAWEERHVAEIVAGRLPPAELRDPVHWATRIDAHLVTLRALSRRSAEALASGAGEGAGVEAQLRSEERDLCEMVHAARDALPEVGMSEVRALVLAARERESGDASVEVARRALDRVERTTSCASADRAPAGD